MGEILLAMEGSTPVLSLALVERGRGTLARMRFDQGESHSRLLPGVLDELLAQGEVGREALAGVAVGIGPGAFTGLRVILATAKGIAYASRIPVVGVSTLEALALGAADRAPVGATLVPLLDARKKEVYAGFFRRTEAGVEAIGPAAALAPEALAERLAELPAPLLLFGEGYRIYREVLDEATAGRRLEPAPEGLPRFPGAEEVAALAFREPLVFDPAALFALEPEYLRKSDAELGWTRPGGVV